MSAGWAGGAVGCEFLTLSSFALCREGGEGRGGEGRGWDGWLTVRAS